MFKCEVIGNLGADAQIKGENGKQFIAFNVAHTDKWTDEAGQQHEETTWVQCIINDTAAKVLPFLLKGKSVFVRGNARLRVFSSAKERRMVAGVTINVRDIELIGGQVDLIPRQLNDEQGVIYPVYKAFYIDPNIKKKPANLLDAQFHKYVVDKNGFITRVQEEPAQADEALQANEYQGENAKTFD